MQVKKANQVPVNAKKIKVNITGQSPSILKPQVHELEPDAFVPTKSGVQGKRVEVKDVVKKGTRTYIKYPGPKPSQKAEYIFTENTPQFDQIQDFVALHNIVNRAQNTLNREVPWAFAKDKLTIYPHVGAWENAYYSRRDEGMKIFYFQDPKTNKIIRLASSNEIVSHEGGHALLDAIRPGFLQTFYPESGALHEAFADINGMISSANFKEVRDEVIKETKGDLSKPNILSNLGEEFAKGLEHEMQKADQLKDPFKVKKYKDSKQPALRKLLNKFKYRPFYEFSPYRSSAADKNAIHAEVHSFSRILSGTLYDIYKDMFSQLMKEKMQNSKTPLTDEDKSKILKEATDEFNKLFLNAAEFMPPTLGGYKNFALSMIYADYLLNKGKYSEVLEKNFKYRDILTGQDIDNLIKENSKYMFSDVKMPKEMDKLKDYMSLQDQRKAKRLIAGLMQSAYMAKVDPNVKFLWENLSKNKFPLIKKYQKLYTAANKLASEVLSPGYSFDEMYRNKDGYTFVLFKKPVKLPIIEVNSSGRGAQLEEKEGALLVFNKDGKLIFKNESKLSDDMKKSIFFNIKNMFARGQIEEERSINIDTQNSENKLYTGVITSDGKLLRYPQID